MKRQISWCGLYTGCVFWGMRHVKLGNNECFKKKWGYPERKSQKGDSPNQIQETEFLVQVQENYLLKQRKNKTYQRKTESGIFTT